MMIALDLMRLLVQVESTNGGMDGARAMEESLRDRITFLETQLSGVKTTFRCVLYFPDLSCLQIHRSSTNLQDVQCNICLYISASFNIKLTFFVLSALLSKVQQLESSMRTADEAAFRGLYPAVAEAHISTPSQTYTTSHQNRAPSPDQPKPKLPRVAWSTESQSQRPCLSATTINFGSSASPDVTGPSYQPNASLTSNPSGLSPGILMFGNTMIQPSSSSPQRLPTKSWDNLTEADLSRWVSFYPRLLHLAIPGTN